ncbi:FMN adenylyltransferase / Riboflavin kinase [hydrothermal vent metagenome]|uniref:Bifunctional riboflavin kinase/FMN adenylyltransferase n=1 Tax=hydrothermal vent metagenome TaxID=652676 RepID=A0A3B0RI24_9ZZZZ
MKIFRHFDNLPDDVKGSVIVLGNFDGFHKGHQTVMGRAGKLARHMKVNLSVLVLEPHPRSFFNPGQEDFRLTSFRTKTHLLEKFGVDTLFVLPFDKKLSKMPAQDFVTDILLDKLGVLHVFVGYDYRFGVGRGGSAGLLSQMGCMEQFGVTIVEKIMDGDHVYSSSNIRDSLRAGEVRLCADHLGHWWHVEGHVLRGDQRGRTINFPTANLPMEGYIKPRLGVYAVRVMVDSGPAKGIWNGVANVGKRPTFNKDDLVLEAHIFDFDFDIYEQSIRVEFVDFIRPEQKFDGLESLKAQIEKDSQVAHKILSDPANQQNLIPGPRLEDHLSS